MITLAIYWKAIGAIAMFLGCIILIGFGLSGIIDLCMSDSRVKRLLAGLL